MTNLRKPSIRDLAEGIAEEVTERQKRGSSRAVEALKTLRRHSLRVSGPSMAARVTENSRTPFLLCEYNGFVHHILFMANTGRYQVFRWHPGARQSSREAASFHKVEAVLNYIRGLEDL